MTCLSEEVVEKSMPVADYRNHANIIANSQETRTAAWSVPNGSSGPGTAVSGSTSTSTSDKNSSTVQSVQSQSSFKSTGASPSPQQHISILLASSGASTADEDNDETPTATGILDRSVLSSLLTLSALVFFQWRVYKKVQPV